MRRNFQNISLVYACLAAPHIERSRTSEKRLRNIRWVSISVISGKRRKTFAIHSKIMKDFCGLEKELIWKIDKHAEMVAHS